MRELLRRLRSDDLGQDLAEYGIAIAVISIAIVAATTAISTNVNTLWTNASAIIASVAGN